MKCTGYVMESCNEIPRIHLKSCNEMHWVSQEWTLMQLAIREGFESDQCGEGVVYVGVNSRYSFLYSAFHADVSLMLVSG